jgi:flavin reductase (DIM6/NTAB) family NADH-FMN oxidoreductase RutF
MKARLGPKDKIIPHPVALVVSGSFRNPNIVTVGKIGIVASDPPVVGISLRKDRYSLQLIRETGQFSVNTPSSKHCRETDYCGIVSGRDSDKIKDIKMTPLRSSLIDSPILKECPYNLECKVIQEIMLGDWVLLLAEICEVHVDEDKLIDSVTGSIDITKVDPMVFCSSINEYRVLGKKVGKGFHDGNSLRKKD